MSEQSEKACETCHYNRANCDEDGFPCTCCFNGSKFTLWRARAEITANANPR